MARRTNLLSLGVVAGVMSLMMCASGTLGYAQENNQTQRDIQLQEILDGQCTPNPAQSNDEITCTFPLTSSVNNQVTADNILIGIRDQNGDIFYEGKRCVDPFVNNGGYVLSCKINLGFRIEDIVNFTSFEWAPDTYQHDIVLIDENTYTEVTDKAYVNIKRPHSPYSSWKSDYKVQTKLMSSLTEKDDIIYQTFVDFNNKIRVRALVPDNQIIGRDTNPYDVTWRDVNNIAPANEFTSKAVDMSVLNGTFYQVHVGSNGRIYTRSSQDAVSWSDWHTDTRDRFEYTRHAVVQAAHNGRLYQVHIGGTGKIYTRSSTNGRNWSRWTRDFNDRYEQTNKPVTMIQSKDKLIQAHIGGNKRIYMRTSTDGVNWSNWYRSETGEDTTNHPVSLAMNPTSGRVYRSRVGLDNKIYTHYSDDLGKTWTVWREYGGQSETPSSIYIHRGILLQTITSGGGYIFWRF